MRLIFLIQYLIWLTVIVGLAAGRNQSHGQQPPRDDRTESNRLEALSKINPQMPPPMPVDLQRVADAGVAVYRGKYIDLYSDISDRDLIQEWIALFDAAVEQWCEKFEIKVSRAKPYRISMMIMQEFRRFENAGLIPEDLPTFPAGYARGHEAWLFRQSTAYYTRHLILHEGTHAFMTWFLGTSGPPWYSEGMAEWLSLHRWDGTRLKLDARLTSNRQAAGWGRVKLIRDQLADGQRLTLDDVLNIPPVAFRDVNYYAWGWAACEFFDHHPVSQDLFRKLPKRLGKPEIFNATFRSKLSRQWDQLETDWHLYIDEVEFGFDVARGAVGQCQSVEVGATEGANGSEASGGVFRVMADRSWQKTSVNVKAGERLEIRGVGRFVIGSSNQPWTCESGGITIEYYNGQPLGKLTAMVLSTADQPQSGRYQQSPQKKESSRFQSVSIGLKKTWTATQDGVLCLRINESPTRLSDNSGHLDVTVVKIK